MTAKNQPVIIVWIYYSEMLSIGLSSFDLDLIKNTSVNKSRCPKLSSVKCIYNNHIANK